MIHLSALEKEKVSVKLLYLFEPSLVNQYQMINEAEDETVAENFAKTFIKKVLSAVGKFMVKFLFIAIIAFLLTLITVEYDIFMLIAKALGLAVIGTYVGDKVSSGVTKATDYLMGQYNQDEARMAKLLLENNFKEINFEEEEDYIFGSCIQIENEKGEKVNKKMSVKDAIVILTKSKDKKTAKEANSIYEDIMLSAKGKIKRKFSSYNWFGLKNILTYLQKKAETIQGYLSSLVKLIISIFSSKNLNESKKIIKKQLKKMIFFNERYLKNKKTEFFYNENYIYPNTKKRLKSIIATFTTNDGQEFKINTINKTISADKNLLKKIFGNNNIESDTYTWNKNEYKLIKSFIENNVNNKETNQINNVQNKTQTVSNKKEQIKNETDNLTDKTENETDNLKEFDKINSSKPSIFSLKIINSMINSSISKYLIIGLIIVIAVLGTATTMGGSAAAEKAKIAAEAGAQAAGLSVEAIAEAGKQAAEAAMEEAKGGNFIFFIQKCIKWLGWPASLGAGLTYAALNGYIKKLTAGELSQTIKTAENNEEAQNTLKNGIDKVENIIKKEEKTKNNKEGFLSKTVNKVKNIFGSKKEITKKETTKKETFDKNNYLNNINIEDTKDEEKYNIAFSLLDDYENTYLASVKNNFLQKYDLKDLSFNYKIKEIGAVIMSNNKDFHRLIEDYERGYQDDLSRKIDGGILDKVVKILQNDYADDLEKYVSGEYIDNSIVNDSYQYIRNKPEILYNETYIMNEYFKIEDKIKRSHS